MICPILPRLFVDKGERSAIEPAQKPLPENQKIMPQYLVAIHHPDDYDPSVDQSFDFTPGHKRIPGYWSHRQCGAQIVSNLIFVERRLKLF